MTPIPDARPMSYSRGEITTFVMPHMQNMLGDLFGGHLMALVDQAAGVAGIRQAGGTAGGARIERRAVRSRSRGANPAEGGRLEERARVDPGEGRARP